MVEAGPARDGESFQCRLKYWTARSCFLAAASGLNVPRFRRLPVVGPFFREYRRYWPEASFRIMCKGECNRRSGFAYPTERDRRGLR